MSYLPDNINTFFLSRTRSPGPLWPRAEKLGSLYFHCDERTALERAADGEREVLLFGDAVDVLTGQKEQLARALLDAADSIAALSEASENLGGQYLILYRDRDDCFLLGDATCSIPIFYTTGAEDFACACSDEILAHVLGLAPDPALEKIRSRASLTQAMPYDVTPYAEIRALLPNHWLDAAQCRSFRFAPGQTPRGRLTPEAAARKLAPMLRTMAAFYTERYRVLCPLTGGRDSRVVFAFLQDAQAHAVPCYTIRHRGMRPDAPDLEIPAALARRHGLDYVRIEDAPLPEALSAFADTWMTRGRYAPSTLSEAWTVKQHCRGGAIANGDIIGQIGKSSLYRDLPLFLAGPRYFRCKLHNYSRESLRCIRDWMDDAPEGADLFDLFSVENRLGRWGGQTRILYHLAGQRVINIFNSGRILSVMMQTARAERKQARLHTALLRLIAPELLQTPFAGDGALRRLIRKTAPGFYLGSFCKYYAAWARFYARGHLRGR